MKRHKEILGESKYSEAEILDPTSSLNKYVLCICGRKYSNKRAVAKHLKTCDETLNSLICEWCNIKFKNRGNLSNHKHFMHGVSFPKKTADQAKDKRNIYPCNVCNAEFASNFRLTYHIRSKHFNLEAKTPQCEKKEINQIWYEKVRNTNLVMEIKKAGASTLIMKPSIPVPNLNIKESQEKIDLSFLYPTGRGKLKVKCKFCNKLMNKIDLKKHVQEKHSDLVKVTCNNCNKVFKRVYIYLKHVCGEPGRKKWKVDGVKQVTRHIASVTSLKPVEVD